MKNKTKKPASTADSAGVSVAQLMALTGCPKKVLTWARKQGCPAFRHGRAYPDEFKEWIISNPPPKSIVEADELDIELKRLKIREQKLKIAELEGASIAISEVSKKVLQIAEELKTS